MVDTWPTIFPHTVMFPLAYSVRLCPSKYKELKLKEILLFPVGVLPHVFLISLWRYQNKPGLGVLFNFVPEHLCTDCWTMWVMVVSFVLEHRSHLSNLTSYTLNQCLGSVLAVTWEQKLNVSSNIPECCRGRGVYLVVYLLVDSTWDVPLHFLVCFTAFQWKSTLRLIFYVYFGLFCICWSGGWCWKASCLSDEVPSVGFCEVLICCSLFHDRELQVHGLCLLLLVWGAWCTANTEGSWAAQRPPSLVVVKLEEIPITKIFKAFWDWSSVWLCTFISCI